MASPLPTGNGSPCSIAKKKKILVQKGRRRKDIVEHGAARLAASLGRPGLPRRRLVGRRVPHHRRRQRVADAAQQDVLRGLGQRPEHQHRRQAHVPVPQRRVQHRGGAEQGAVRRVQPAQRHQPVPEGAHHHRAHQTRPALLLLRRRRALRARPEGRHRRLRRRLAAARRAQPRRARGRLAPPGRPLPPGRIADGDVIIGRNAWFKLLVKVTCNALIFYSDKRNLNKIYVIFKNFLNKMNNQM
jgi:hypothetical protein